MAIPASYFQAVAAIALMRMGSDNQWRFVKFVQTPVDIIIDTPGPGGFTYQLWQIIGQSFAGTSCQTSGAEITLAATNLQR